MVFGGYADDLRTRPSAITSLSKMPRIRVLVIGHGLCPARELARSLNASAFLVTYLVELPTSLSAVSEAPMSGKVSAEVLCTGASDTAT